MITWIGFLAKLTEFFVTKVAGRRIDLSSDRRHRAAKALVRFYHALAESGAILTELLEIFGNAYQKKKPILFSKDIVPFENRITRLNEELARQFDELVRAIGILYPDLASLLYKIRGFKTATITSFGILLKKARFEIEYDGLHPFKKISFTTFRDGVAEIDFEEFMKSSTLHRDDFPYTVPESNRLAEALSVLLVEDEFTSADFEKMAYLQERLVNQKVLLDEATKLLRVFIAQNFTFSDLLHVSDAPDIW